MKQAWSILLAFKEPKISNNTKIKIKECIGGFLKHKICCMRFLDEISIISNLNVEDEPNVITKFVKVSVDLVHSSQELLDSHFEKSSSACEPLLELFKVASHMMTLRVAKRKFERNMLILSNIDIKNIGNDIQSYLALFKYASKVFVSLSSLKEENPISVFGMEYTLYKNYLLKVASAPKGAIKNVVNKYQGGTLNISDTIIFPVQIFTRTERNRPPNLSKVSLPVVKSLLETRNISVSNSSQQLYDTLNEATKTIGEMNSKSFGKITRDMVYYYYESDSEEEEDDDDTEKVQEKHFVEKGSEVYGYTFGDEDIPIDHDLMKKLSYRPNCEFRVLYFIKSTQVREELAMSTVDVVCFRDNFEIEGSCNSEAFSKIIFNLIEQDKVGICKLTSRVKAIYTRVVKIVPFLTVTDHRTKEKKRIYSPSELKSLHPKDVYVGLFLLYQLPTTHDMRQYHMESIEETDTSETCKTDVDKVIEWMDNSHLSESDYSPETFSDPRLDNFFERCSDIVL